MADPYTYAQEDCKYCEQGRCRENHAEYARQFLQVQRAAAAEGDSPPSSSNDTNFSIAEL